MKTYSIKSCILLVLLSINLFSHSKHSSSDNHTHNRALGLTTPISLPDKKLLENAYKELPLGTVQAEGWLRQKLQRMAKGMTGNLDTLYEEVCGPRNGWLGGDGDVWERGPYWIDGLYPLSRLLGDPDLQKKANKWVEWTLNNQRENGQIGPYQIKDEDRKVPPPPGTQHDRADDWWPRMVMLKILMQHYSATQDPRVIDCMTKYFKYQLKELPNRPLFNEEDKKNGGSWWARRRGGDNLMAVYWLYHITGDEFLLELGDLVYSQTTPYTDQFLERVTIPQKRYEGSGEGFDYVPHNHNSYHCVNLAQGMKTPIIRYQADRDPRHLEAIKIAFADIERYHGQPHGLYGADEGMHGRSLTRGSEFCTAVEMMFSLEKMLEITGDITFADRLEMIAFNVLPTQATDDFSGKQYYQQANQISVTFGSRNFHNDNGDRLVFGLTSGYPCCTTNMHQGWPKFVSHLWMEPKDGGLAALLYSPSKVSKTINGEKVVIHERTQYPMEDEIRFVINTTGSVSFPLHLRVPSWCEQPLVTHNGSKLDINVEDGKIVLEKTWNDGDRLVLKLPNPIRTKRWHQNSASLYWGPLLFALKMKEEWSTRTEPSPHGKPYQEVRSTSTWNVAMLENEVKTPNEHFSIKKLGFNGKNFWNVDNAPLSIRVNGYIHETWDVYLQSAGPIPFSPQNPFHKKNYWRPKPIAYELIPYGCTTLRVCAFPTFNKPANIKDLWKDPSDY